MNGMAIASGIVLFILLTVSISWHRKSAWEGSLDSPAALGHAVVDALNRGDIDGLHRLRVTQDEYLSWIWPAFPASRPPYNFTPDFAWSKCNNKVALWALRTLHSEQLMVSQNLNLRGHGI